MAHPKTARVLIASGAATASQASKVQQDEHARGIRLYLTITASSGTGGLQVVIRGYDRVPGAGNAQDAGLPANPITGGTVQLSAGGAPVTQVGTYAYELSPQGGTPRGAVMDVTQAALPWRWDALVVAADNSSYTYSLSAETA
jgi:hypothetical protein